MFFWSKDIFKQQLADLNCQNINLLEASWGGHILMLKALDIVTKGDFG